MTRQQTLEEKLPSSITETLPTIDDFATQFSERYQQEEPFREMVHQYLSLTKGKRFKLRVGKVIRPSWYRRTTSELIRNYATRIRTDLEEAQQLKQEMNTLTDLEGNVRERQNELGVVQQQKQHSEQEYQKARATKEEEERRLKEEWEQQKKEEQEKMEEHKAKIVQETDATAVAGTLLKGQLERSSLVQKGDDGEISFNEDKIMEKLEGILLAETIEGIEKEDGKGGFMAKVKEAYDGIVSHREEITDLSQVPRIDWLKSMIYSATKGYDRPTFPYLMVKVMEGRGKTSITTAICIDSSSSMKKNERMAIAKKAGLATRGLMRKVNPHNETYFAHFNEEIAEVTPAELYRSVMPVGNTRTDLALEWIMKKLDGQGPSIGYLVTDGIPYWWKDAHRSETEEEIIRRSLNETLEVAQKFRELPIMLRIFLIDGTKKAEENIQEIGKATGPRTRVIPIKNYQLANGMVRDVYQAIGQMYSV